MAALTGEELVETYPQRSDGTPGAVPQLATTSQIAALAQTGGLRIYSVLAYGAKCDGVTDDAAAFQATANALMNDPFGGVFYIPPGDCVLGSHVTASIGAKQRFLLRSDSMHSARLHWSNSGSAGFAITMNAVVTGNWISDGPSVSAEDITNISTWSTTTSQTALAITSTAGDNITTFQRPSVPSVFVKNFNSISQTNSGGFASLLALTNIATVKIEDLSMWASTGDTTAGAVTLSSTGAVYTGIRFDGLRQQAGGTALTITDSPGGTGGFQGIYVTDMQTVGTQRSISWTNPNGYTGADNLQVDHSQLNSALGEIVTSGVTDVQVTNTYFLTTATGWTGLSLTGGSNHTVVGNIFKKSGGADATGIGIHATNVTGSTFADNALFALSGTTSGAAPILLDGTGGTNAVTGNTSNTTDVVFDANTNAVTDRLTGNVGGIGGANAFVNTLGASGSSVTNLIAAGADGNIQIVYRAKGLPSLDHNFQDGNAHTLLSINDSQSATVNGMNITAGGAGVSPTLKGANATNLLVGVTGSPLATNTTAGFPQIPYMAGQPTGTPATTGGASLVYDTTNKRLWVYDPTSAAWE